MRREARGGYALPVVLAVVGVLALVFAAAASALSGLGAGARAAVEGADFRAAALSAEAEALFMTATHRFAPQGLASGATPSAGAAAAPAAVRLDGRPYAWSRIPGLRVALQDEAGLMNLDSSRPDTLLRLFARLGLSATEAESLSDRLLDAVEGAKQPRPRGAVAADYAAAGLPAPTPGGFDGLADVDGVLGWPALIGGSRRRALEAWTTATPGSTAFNVNTAPIPVLAMVLNVSDAAAAGIAARREAGPVTALSQLGLPPAPAGTAEPVRPNGRVRVTVEDARRGLRYTSRLAPLDAPGGPPWSASGGAVVRTTPARTPPDAPFLPDPSGSSAPR